MRVLGRVLAVLACVVLAAHFLRRAAGAGAPVLYAPVLVCLALPLLLLVRKTWGVLVLRLALAAGVVVWITAALAIRRERMAEGRPAGKAMVILGSVAAVTALAALVLRPRATAATDRGSGRSSG